MEADLKIRLARAQLGTALDLFIRDKDPISVHTLASAGSELLDGITNSNEVEGFSKFILGSNISMDYAKIKYLKNQYWNAMKHFTDRKDKIRDDYELMRSFSDKSNDIILFMGWYDYGQLLNKLPIAAQVFQAWWFALNEDKLSENSDPDIFSELFPSIQTIERREQKRRLRRAVEKFRKQQEVLDDPRTESTPLVMQSDDWLT